MNPVLGHCTPEVVDAQFPPHRLTAGPNAGPGSFVGKGHGRAATGDPDGLPAESCVDREKHKRIKSSLSHRFTR